MSASGSARLKLLQHLQSLEHIRLDGLRFRLIDAKDQVVGRLAADISTILQGKDKPTYNPKHNMGDVVVVVNAAHVHFSHDKWRTKLYRWHTGYPGGLRSRAADEQWERDPTRILWHAVNGMLPKNRMRTFRLDKLKIFPEAEHAFEGLDMVPFVPRPRLASAPEISWPLPEGFAPMNKERFAARAMAGRRAQPKQPLQSVEEGFAALLSQEELGLLREESRAAAGRR